jgi:hypothetical protein
MEELTRPRPNRIIWIRLQKALAKIDCGLAVGPDSWQRKQEQTVSSSKPTVAFALRLAPEALRLGWELRLAARSYAER